MEYPIKEVRIPHKHAISGEGDVVPVNYLLPPRANPATPPPQQHIINRRDRNRTPNSPSGNKASA